VRFHADMKALRWWVLARLTLPILVVLLAPSFVGGLVGERLSTLVYAHGLVKMGIVAWQSMLVREVQLGWFLLFLLVAGAVCGGLKGARWWWGTGIAALGAALLLRPLAVWTVPIAVIWLGINVAPAGTLVSWGTRWRRYAWIPGTEFLFGGALAAALGAGPRLLRVAGASSAVVVGATWIIADTFASFWAYEQVVFAPWPDDRVDPRVTTVARAPAGVKCEYHDVDIVGDRAVVVAETSLQLLNIPKVGAPTAWPLPPWWGEVYGLTMDSETDPLTGTTWYLSGPTSVTGVAWQDGWKKVSESPKLPAYLHHTYMHWLPDRDRLVLFTIGTQNTMEATLMIELETPSLRLAGVHRLRVDDGGRPPTFRDLTWVPVLGKFVLAPDFGDHLYLATPGSEVVERWMEMPTLNGRIVWVNGLDRLLVPMPNQPELWVVDPTTATVERKIPTQLGVRAVAVDVSRGVFLTASVLTGRVLVQRLDDGAVVDSFGTLMPMARNLAIFPDSGEALLSTWTALYRIPYAAGL
jgi:hypothetical protein